MALAAATAVLAGVSHDLASAQGAAWDLTVVTPADRGTVGARWPAASWHGAVTAFTHDGDLPTAGGPGNPDGNQEVWTHRQSGLTQLTATSRVAGVTPEQSVPSLDGAGAGVAFLSNADFGGQNADGSQEVWLARAGGFQAISGTSQGTAEWPALSPDGGHVVFWHDGDLTGENPDGGVELFRATVGGPIRQITNLTGRPYHDMPAVSAGGAYVAFIVDADLVGANTDGSWELYLWEERTGTVSQITDWAPPMTGREIYHPSISGDGRRIAFAGRGDVDARLGDPHTELEIYLWSADGAQATGGLRRLTTRTAANASSLLPRIAEDGRAISFVSLSDHAPNAPGNPESNQDLFVWSECLGFLQVTAGAGRPRVVANVPELRPAVDGRGHNAAFVSERDDDLHPLALPSRRGIFVRAANPAAVPCVPTPAPTVTPTQSPPPQPSPSTPPPNPTAPPGSGAVCPQVVARIPAAVQAHALAQPEAFYGWNLPANPGLAPGHMNPMRRWLSIRDPGKPYGPANPAVWKAGCP
jgi:Tol biopolymer transport system component